MARFFFDGHTYEFVATARTWQDASAYAQTQGGHLAAITSASENNAVIQAALAEPSLVSSASTANDGGGAKYLWLGATDSAFEGRFAWVTGEAFSLYNAWASGPLGREPDNFGGAQDALAMALEAYPRPSGGIGSAGLWNDVNESNTLSFVIEYDELRGTDASETIQAGTGAETIRGLAGDDTLRGLAGDDTIFGDDGQDILFGDENHDNLFGGAGADTLSGGGGNDHLYGQSANGGTDGADSLSGGDGSDYLQGNAGNDTLDGGDGSDRINGGGSDDSISGSTGNDTVNGNLGNDTIDGGADNDSIRGGQGNDSLSGGNGNDILSGDLGTDTLSGGSGADIFQFSGQGSTSTAPDQITGFEGGSDRISLGFTPLVVLTGSAQSSLSSAVSAAQALFDSNAGTREVAAIAIGSDTYLLYAADGGATVNSAIQITGVSTSAFSVADFI